MRDDKLNEITPEQRPGLEACAKFMGWTTLPFYYEQIQEAGVYFFLMGGKRPLYAKSQETDWLAREQGSLDHWLAWENFNPYANMNDLMLVMDRFNEIGQTLYINFERGKMFVFADPTQSIQLDKAFMHAEGADLGMAVMNLVVKWIGRDEGIK